MLLNGDGLAPFGTVRKVSVSLADVPSLPVPGHSMGTWCPASKLGPLPSAPLQWECCRHRTHSWFPANNGTNTLFPSEQPTTETRHQTNQKVMTAGSCQPRERNRAQPLSKGQGEIRCALLTPAVTEERRRSSAAAFKKPWSKQVVCSLCLWLRERSMSSNAAMRAWARHHRSICSGITA